MKERELEKLLAEETEASERTRDEPMRGGVRRGGAKSAVYSLRLTPDQIEAIGRIADEAGIPASVLVRDWVVAGLRAEQAKDDPVLTVVESLSRDVERLRHLLAG